MERAWRERGDGESAEMESADGESSFVVAVFYVQHGLLVHNDAKICQII